MGVPREYEYEYSEDRIGIVWGGAGLGMGVESSGLCGRGKFAESSGVRVLKVLGKFEG